MYLISTIYVLIQRDDNAVRPSVRMRKSAGFQIKLFSIELKWFNPFV